MPFIYNNTTVNNLYYNNTDIYLAYYNGQLVFQKNLNNGQWGGWWYRQNQSYIAQRLIPTLSNAGINGHYMSISYHQPYTRKMEACYIYNYTNEADSQGATILPRNNSGCIWSGIQRTNNGTFVLDCRNMPYNTPNGSLWLCGYEKQYINGYFQAGGTIGEILLS